MNRRNCNEFLRKSLPFHLRFLRFGYLPIVIISGFLLPLKIDAHPHMFIDVMVKFMLTDSTLAGFYVYWDFDEMNSEMLINEFDEDKSKHFDSLEIQKIETDAFSFSLRSNLFILFTWEKNVLKIRKMERFNATIQPQSRVRYSFHVPCNIPLEQLLEKNIIMFFEDPSMYIDFNVKKDMIQCTSHDSIISSITFKRQEYIDRIILTLRRRAD